MKEQIKHVIVSKSYFFILWGKFQLNVIYLSN